MTNKERIQNNNNELLECIEIAENLPDIVEINLQEKTATPTTSQQTVIADSGYDGLSKVTVNPIPEGYIIPSGTKDISTNGTHDISTFESVKVNVPIPDGYIKPSGVLNINENGTKDVTTYASVSIDVAPTLQEKTVNPTTSSQSVTPDNGYDGLSKVTVNAMSTATQATPTISVSSGGLITASSTQSAGYVASGTRSATKQLTVQAAKTITPSASTQTAVASGRYTTGAITVAPIPSSYVKPSATKGATTYTPTTSNQTIASGTYLSGTQTIKGDANLKAENIKSGVSIFGVTGTHSGAEDLDAELTAQETKIAELSALLDAKASGGSVLTANVAFSFKEDIMGLMPPTASVTFTNSSMIPETFEMEFGNNNVYEKTIVVGTIISIFFTYDMGYSDTTTNGSVERISETAMGGQGMMTFKVTGNSNSSVLLSLQ